ncbi:MAG: guanylate kinase [Chloroflexi bacterium]|nr:guanylate kinase [Chloroflexota bacterium]
MPVPLVKPSPLLVVLSGPSGVGKDAVLKTMKQRDYPLHYSVTLTTRAKRQNEREGVDYYFTSVDKFREMIAAGELLEWAQVYGNYYGVPRTQVRQAMASGKDVLLKVDVQGAATVRGLAPEAVLVFLLPPSFEELRQRLMQRHTDFAMDLERRLAAARVEMDSLELFDYAVVNRSEALGEAAVQIEAIITAEKCRTKPRVVMI